MTSTLSCAHKSCYVWCFPLAAQINQAREDTIVPHLTIPSPFLSPPRHAFIPFRYSRHPNFDPRPPFLLSSRSVFTFLQLPSSVCPSIHPHTASHRYCASLSSLSDSQSCNATPLTCESQQSVALVRETCLEAAAVPSFSESK